jgi:hypothetical protein
MCECACVCMYFKGDMGNYRRAPAAKKAREKRKRDIEGGEEGGEEGGKKRTRRDKKRQRSRLYECWVPGFRRKARRIWAGKHTKVGGGGSSSGDGRGEEGGGGGSSSGKEGGGGRADSSSNSGAEGGGGMAGSNGSRKCDRKPWSVERKARRISVAESLKKEVIEMLPNTREIVNHHESVLAAASAAKMRYPARMGELCRQNKKGPQRECNGRIFMYATDYNPDYNLLRRRQTREKQKCAAGGRGGACGGGRVNGRGGRERAAGLMKEGTAPAAKRRKKGTLDLGSSRGVLHLGQLHDVQIVVQKSNSPVRECLACNL